MPERDRRGRRLYAAVVWRIRQLLGISNYWDKPLPIEMLCAPKGPLDVLQMDDLWSMFRAIPTHWDLPFEVELLRSRWLDMIEARSRHPRDYLAEYHNAACVFSALVVKLGEKKAIEKMYGKTRVTDKGDAVTRLAHAKFYVANDFIRCFVATGGFRGFVPEARNYTGFMGGSRFREWDPVRTGKRK